MQEEELEDDEEEQREAVEEVDEDGKLLEEAEEQSFKIASDFLLEEKGRQLFIRTGENRTLLESSFNRSTAELLSNTRMFLSSFISVSFCSFPFFSQKANEVALSLESDDVGLIRASKAVSE